jgi:hypothetical protein
MLIALLIWAPIAWLAILATSYSYEKLGKRTQSEESFFLNLLGVVILASAVLLTGILFVLIDGWIGWE